MFLGFDDDGPATSARARIDMSLPAAILTLAVFQPELHAASAEIALLRVASLVSCASIVVYRCGFNIASSGCAVAGTFASRGATYCKSNSFLNFPIDAPCSLDRSIWLEDRQCQDRRRYGQNRRKRKANRD